MDIIKNCAFLLLFTTTIVLCLTSVPDERMRDCQEWREKYPVLPTGVYTIYPAGRQMDVWCDMDTEGGGWTVFQRRFDGSIDFYRSWIEYREGFGQVNGGEFWLGNNNIHILTNSEHYELRVDLEACNEKAFAAFGSFFISEEKELYKLYVADYNDSSTAGDSLTYHSGRYFSTKYYDYDYFNDKNCAQISHGAWWYGGGVGCHLSNLNGRYEYTAANLGRVATTGVSMSYYDYKGYSYALKAASMKVRRQGVQIATCQHQDANPMCPRMAADGKCVLPDVKKYCPKSCLC